MIHVKILVFNPFRENTYIVSDETGECIIVDPGCENKKENEQLRSEIISSGLKPVQILNTHCHIDHILGDAFVKGLFSIPLLIHKLEIPLLNSSSQQRMIFGLEEGLTPEPDAFIDEGDMIRFGNTELEVLHIPGHSPGSIALVCHKEKIAFVGDVLFQGSIGRTDLPGGSFDSLIQNIREKLLTLDPETVVYPGHGPATTISTEISSNPFLT
jgi:glyoxylase-like metal-dependent hydrolase (beta-lactamase superfamily II)